MFKLLGAIVSRYWVAVILFWILAVAGLRAVAPRWDEVTHDGDLAYLPARMPSVEGELLLARAFPKNLTKSQVAIVVERADGPLAADDWEWADALAARFEQQRGDLPVVEIWTRNTEIVGDKLVSRPGPNGQATVVLLQLSNEFMATDNIRVLGRLNEVLDDAAASMPAGLRTGLTGSAAIGGDMLSSAAESIQNTELATVVLVVVILLAVYRAPALVLIPMLTIGVSLVIATDLLALLTQAGRLPGFDWWNFKIFTTTKIFIVVILFGAGTDFCLFLISRYREELQRGLSRAAAVSESVSQIGAAILGSALTTIFGLSTMYFADFGKFSNSGPAIALCLAVTLCASLTLAPALLRGFGRIVFWPFNPTPASSQPVRAAVDRAGTRLSPSRFWDAISRGIIARPGWILLGSFLLLSPLAYEGVSVPITYDFLNELEADRPSVRGTELARRHFPAGEMAPLSILALKHDGQFDAGEGERQIALLTKDLYEVDGVVHVRSIAEPTGDTPGYFQPLRASGLKKLAARKHKRTEATYLSQVPELVGDVARFDLVLKYEPFSTAAVAALNELDQRLLKLSQDPNSAWHGARFTTVGATVGIRDLQVVTEGDQALIQQLVVLSVLAVLIVLLRRPLVCLYLIVSVLFSYFVTIGVTELFFSWCYGPTFHGLDWKVPIFLFVILIAVGEDYNIYLVTRVFEEQRRHGLSEGLRLAIARTGGIITSCGVIMAGTFVSMMTGSLRGMQELGFALSLGVILDTCVVRPVLVPAFLALVQGIDRQPRPQAQTRNSDRSVPESARSAERHLMPETISKTA